MSQPQPVRARQLARSHMALLATLFVALAVAPPATAGIIVTEGKINVPAGPALTATRRLLYLAPSSSSGLYAKHQDGEAQGDDAEEGAPGELGDLENPAPTGWSCHLVGGGIEVCEPLGLPPSAPAPTGTRSSAAALGDGATEGCQGGASHGTLASLALATWALLRRRARA